MPVALLTRFVYALCKLKDKYKHFTNQNTSFRQFHLTASALDPDHQQKDFAYPLRKSSYVDYLEACFNIPDSHFMQ